MAAPFPGTVWIITDAAGQPVSGAKIRTYEAGTLTDKAVYTTAALSTPASNPVIADASGRAQFFLGSGSYRFKVFDSSDVELTAYAADNVSDSSGLVTALETALATAGTSTGAAQVGFTQGGTGSVDMTVQQVLRERVNVQRLGVVIDSGTVDNTDAWQDILDRTDVKGGLILEVPGACTMKLSDELTSPAGVTIQGASSVDKVYGTRSGFEAPTMFWQSGAGKAVFVITEGARDIALRDFALSAAQVPAAYTAPTSGKYGIKCHGEAPYSAYGLDLDRLGFYQFERAISVADDTPGTGTDWQCDSIKVKRCRFFSNLHGLYLNTITGDAIELDTCTFNIWTNGSGVYVKRSGYWSARNTYWVAAETAASVLATGAAGVYMADYQSDIIDILNCQAEPGMAYFLKVDNSTGYETNEMPINIRSSLIEAPIQLDRKCRVLLDHCRASDDIVVAGNDVVMDYDLPLFIGGGAFSVTGTNFKRIPRPAETGSTASIATATATTLFALPASAGTYEVACWLTGGGSLYATTARFLCDGTTLIKVGADAGANVSLTASSRNVQITQTSGVTQTMQWSWRRLS